MQNVQRADHRIELRRYIKPQTTEPKMRNIDLDIDTPNKLPKVLRLAAELFTESAGELADSWQDENAGKIWKDFAIILERAAKSAENALAKR